MVSEGWHIDQCNRVENRNKPVQICSVDLDKIHKWFNRESIAFSTNDARAIGYSQAKNFLKRKKKFYLTLTPVQKLSQMDNKLKCETKHCKNFTTKWWKIL